MTTARTVVLGAVLAGATLCLVAAAAQPTPAPKPQPGPQGAVYLPVQGPYRVGSYNLVQPSAQAGQLARDYVKAEKEEQKKDIRKKLNELLGGQFDQQMKQQQKELEELEKQIANLRSTLTKRREARDTIIERRADQLVHEAEGLGWNAPGPPRPIGSGGFTPLMLAPGSRISEARQP